jgi:hypothetical protein
VIGPFAAALAPSSRSPRPRARSVWLAVAVALGMGQGGCRRRAEPPPAPSRPALGEVSVRDVTPAADGPAPIELSIVRDALRARLMESGLFAAQAPAADAAVALVRVRCDLGLEGAEVDEKGVARAMVRLRLDTRPSDAPLAIEEDLRGEGEQLYAVTKPVRPAARAGKASAPSVAWSTEKQALFSKLALRVARDLIDGFAAREKLHDAPAADIHAAIRGDAGELREEAIRIAGERKLRDEGPTLLGLLDDPSEAVRDAALGALIQLGDRRAVTVLTKSRSLRDRREMRKILEALAALGGQEALDYLSFIAQSHDDEEIRDLAGAAKARLERHMNEAGVANQ